LTPFSSGDAIFRGPLETIDFAGEFDETKKHWKKTTDFSVTVSERVDGCCSA
jgi:hypothetical protein